MKTKIGEKETKAKSNKSWAATYPGAVLLAAIVVIGGIGAGAVKLLGNKDVVVGENDKPAVTEPADKEQDKAPAEDGNKETDAEPADVEPEDLAVLQASVLEDDVIPMNASVSTLQALEDSIEIREMVGEVQSGDDGNNSQQTAEGAETETPASDDKKEENKTEDKQTGDKKPAEGTSEKDTVAKEDDKTKTEDTVVASGNSLSAKAKAHKNNVNGDTIGWLRIPNTNIDYPVVQSTNNNFYVYKDYNKNYDKNGVIYADYECNFKGGVATNNVIYGHNWSNVYSKKVADPSDIMFGQLPSFHTLSFAQKTPFIYFSTLEKDYVWQVFAAFYVEESFNYISAYPSKDQYKTIISEAMKRSLHNYNVNVTTSDQILTLSTCTRVYGQRSDQRFVVMAKRVKAGTSSTSITSHPNFKAPQF